MLFHCFILRSICAGCGRDNVINRGQCPTKTLLLFKKIRTSMRTHITFSLKNFNLPCKKMPHTATNVPQKMNKTGIIILVAHVNCFVLNQMSMTVFSLLDVMCDF